MISSFDNHTLATCIPTGFYRELLSNRKLHLSAKSIDDKRFSMGFSDGNITVNEVASKNINIPSSFNIFKKAIDIRLLNTISVDLGYGWWENRYPIFFISGYRETKWREAIRDTNPWQWETTTIEKQWTEDDFVDVIEIALDYYYINPNTGELKKETTKLNLIPILPKTQEDVYAELREEYAGEDVDFWARTMMYEGAAFAESYHIRAAMPEIINNQIGFNLYTVTGYDLWEGLFYTKRFHVPISDPPTEIQSWNNPEDNGLTLNSLCLPCDSADSAISKKLPCCLNGIFNEVATNTKFAFEIPSLAKIDSNGNTSGLLSDNNYGAGILNYGDTNSYKKDYRNRNRSMSNLHIATLQGQLLVFRSELNPDVFDFDNELLRSVVS